MPPTHTSTTPLTEPAVLSNTRENEVFGDQSPLVPELVGKVYEMAPASERTRLLAHLMRPLGVLSLAAVANGIFVKIRFDKGWGNLNFLPEDLQGVKASDVVSLVDFVQQVSVQAVDGLAQVLSTSPLMTGSAAVAVLVALLATRASTRAPLRDDDSDPTLR